MEDKVVLLNLKHLANLREDLDRAKSELAVLEDNFFNRPDVQALTTSIVETKGDIERTEAALRQAAIDCYKLTGNKSPYPGLGVRVSVRLDYNEAEALAYCIERKLDAALKLDNKKFEAAALVLRPPFVKETETESATIARDLSKHSEGESEI